MGLKYVRIPPWIWNYKVLFMFDEINMDTPGYGRIMVVVKL